jgi:NifU-like protein involved in Fe-S cluster formation
VQPLAPDLRKFLLDARHGGSLPGEAAAADNQACGDHVEIALALAGEGIERAGFRGSGCSAMLAIAELACARVEGRSLDDAAAFDLPLEVESLGGLPPTRRHALDVVSRALAGALALARGRCHP